MATLLREDENSGACIHHYQQPPTHTTHSRLSGVIANVIFLVHTSCSPTIASTHVRFRVHQALTCRPYAKHSEYQKKQQTHSLEEHSPFVKILSVKTDERDHGFGVVFLA